MNAMSQALSVYNKAKNAIAKRVATVQDEVVVALWELVQEQGATISVLDYKISTLNATDSAEADDMQEANEVLNRVRSLH